MSNYKWLKMSDNFTTLRNKDFSLISGFEVDYIDPILFKKLQEKDILPCLDGDGVLEPCRYVLNPTSRKLVTITAPLYKYNSEHGDFVLLAEAYTDYTIDPTEYDFAKEIYSHCVEEVASEQAKIFKEIFIKNSLDGISSIITICSDSYEDTNDFFEQYIPKEYIKVCEKNYPFTCTKHEVVFIKEMDAKSQTVNIKIPDLYKGLVIGKGGENIRRIAKMINASKINVI